MGKSYKNIAKDDKMLLSSFQDRLRRCSQNYMITCSNFLDLRQRSLISQGLSHNGYKDIALTKDPDISVEFYGGYPLAERVLAICLPPYIPRDAAKYFYENPEDDPLALLRATLPKGSPSLSHRDYLGSLMSIGIKRDITGDIITYENGADFIVLKDMVEYISLNMVNAGKASISWEILPLKELRNPSINQKNICAFVSSLRLDAVISAAFGLSRTGAKEAISSGIVYVDSLNIQKPEVTLSPPCKLVIRGKGKAIFSSIKGTSTKGRVIINIEKFV